MARPSQRRKSRNPSTKVSRKCQNRLKKHKKPLGEAVPDVLLPHWNRDSSLLENYERWGLVARVNGISGGAESRKAVSSIPLDDDVHALHDNQWTELDFPDSRPRVGVLSSSGVKASGISSHHSSSILEKAIVERDADGKIVGIKSIVSLGDEDSKPAVQNAIIEALEAKSNITHKAERFQSPGEVAFVVNCIQKYGKDYKAMSRDLKLNRLQYTPIQIQKRITKYLADTNQEIQQ